MATVRRPHIIDRVLGEDDRSALTDQSVYGGRACKVNRLRNYHVIGRARLLSRRGYKPYVLAQVNGSAPVQALYMDEWGITRDLYAVAGGALMLRVVDAWSNVTGTATIASGENKHIRWGNFTDGSYNWLFGADGTNIPFAVRNGQSAVPISDLGLVPEGNFSPADMIEHHGHILALDDYTLYHTAYGTWDFPNGGKIDTQRRSKAVGMTLHSQNVVILFYEHVVYMLEYQPHEGATWRALPIAGADGCVSKGSIFTKDGYTYYAGAKGLNRIDPNMRVKLLTPEVQDYWDSLNQSRRYQIQAVERGSPWTEVMFLVSEGGSAHHDAVMVWQDQLDAWSIFPRGLSSSATQFNCGCNWRDSSLLDRTLFGGLDGYVYEAFGTSNTDSGLTDNGVAIRYQIQTGFMNFGYPGIVATREVIIDGEVTANIDFNIAATTLGGQTPVQKTLSMGVSGDLLDVGFRLDESYLSDTSLSQGHVSLNVDGRGVQLDITRTSSGETPHILTAFTIPHLLKRMKST